MMFRSVTHGTCALGGRHTSEAAAAECPALGANAQERLVRFREPAGEIMRTVEIDCARCGQTVWPYLAEVPTEYVCHRCRAVLAGGNAIDPLPTEAQREHGQRLSAARRTARAEIRLTKEAPNPSSRAAAADACIEQG